MTLQFRQGNDCTWYSLKVYLVHFWTVPGTLLFCLFIATGLPAQDTITDPAKAYNMAAKAIADENWDEGLQAVGGILRAYPGEEGRKNFGPAFGHFYYLRGLIQTGKKQYTAAGDSFRICYEQYANPDLGERRTKENKDIKLNIFQNASLVQWANIEMHLQRFDKAAELYQKALDEGAGDPKVNRIYVTVNLGRCMIRSGDLEGGFKRISPALSNKIASEGLKQVIFMILAEDWSPQVELPPMREFIDEFRAIVSLDDPQDRFERNPRFQALAQAAFAENDPIRALAWYSLMIDPMDMVPPLDEEIAALDAREVVEEMQEKKEEFLQNLRDERQKVVDQSWDLLNGAGSVHFQMKNFAAAFVVFAKLSDAVPSDHAERPLFLHNAVASAAQISKWSDAYRYGKIFLDAYPDHELMPAVARVLVEVIFLRGEYQEAYDISGEVRTDMETGAEVRDIPDFVYGASAFHLERIDEAESELLAYLSNYPEGQRREPVMFYAGLTKVRLFKWEEAAALFNQFIEQFPESSMLPDALYQGGLSEFMIDQIEPALAKAERILNEFPDHQVVAKAWNLKGDIFVTDGRPFEEVETAYLNGKNIADTISGEEETAAYSLWQLLINTSEISEWEKAQVHLNEFDEKHSNSIYKLDFLAASLPALVALDRKQEGLDKLRRTIFEYGDDPQSSELAEMFGSYLDYLKSNYTKEEAAAELETHSESAFEVPALRGWYAIGQTEVLGDEEKEKRDAILYRINTNFDPSLHSNYVIVQLARWVVEHRKQPAEAKVLYDYIIVNRPGTANYNYALVDTAKLLAESDQEEERAEALTRFEQVLREVPDEELQELAVLGSARIYSRNKNFVEAEKWWSQYLDNREWTVSRPEANYEYARSFDEQGKVSEALKIYVSVYANFPGHLDWSTRAYVRTAIILKNGGHELKALLVLRDMLKRMGHHDHPVVDEAKKLFVKWRSEYQPEPKSGNKGKG